MRIKDGFVVRKIASQYMAVPVGERTQELHGMIGLNETGAFLWELLKEEQTEESLAGSLCEEYEVTPEQALESIQQFVEKLRSEGVLANE